MKISAALLAAGRSERMGKNKLLLPFGDRTVIEESLSQLAAAKPVEIIVVTGFQEDKIRARIDGMRIKNLRIIHNPHFRDGRSESIKCAVINIDKSSDALLFMVADKPTVNERLIKKAMDEFKKQAPPVLYVHTPAGRGHPVIFSRKIFSDLLRLKSEPVGDSIFEKYREDTLIVEDEHIQIDIDTPDDYNEVIRMMSV